MNVLVEDMQEAVPVEPRLVDLIKRTVEAGLEDELSSARRDRAEVSVALVDDRRIRELNREYRETDCATDVLSFAMLEGLSVEEEHAEEEHAEEEPLLLGDIVISLERAKNQAAAYGHSFEREVAFLTLHGLLHLLGHDHHTADQEAEMNDRQEAILERLGLPR